MTTGDTCSWSVSGIHASVLPRGRLCSHSLPSHAASLTTPVLKCGPEAQDWNDRKLHSAQYIRLGILGGSRLFWDGTLGRKNQCSTTLGHVVLIPMPEKGQVGGYLLLLWPPHSASPKIQVSHSGFRPGFTLRKGDLAFGFCKGHLGCQPTGPTSHWD